ncbi:hypothetical protein [Albimonas pacifica]|uniref:hypothetical protein n=1 Tax=Albimonas pacifica TaxID=1114924 RepID=UPI000AFCDE5C|nr:hypothetical protein [Albimonas pacifica]
MIDPPILAALVATALGAALGAAPASGLRRGPARRGAQERRLDRAARRIVEGMTVHARSAEADGGFDDVGPSVARCFGRARRASTSSAPPASPSPRSVARC